MALALAWAGFLRGNEVLQLQWKDIGLPGDPRLSGISNATAGVNIKDGKTGLNQFVPINDQAVIRMLRLFSKQKSQNPLGRVFSLAYPKYLKLIRDVSILLGLSETLMTTHSARIGGAVHAFASKTDAKDIAITGRWESLKSLRRYLTNGRGWLMTLNLSEDSKLQIDKLKDEFTKYFEK